jgi:PilX N-terminal
MMQNCGQKENGGNDRLAPVPGGQRGIALILALVMLALLGMLGALALNRSSTELHITGNYRNQQIAYYNADDVEGQGPNNVAVLTSITPYVVNSYPTGTGMLQVALPAGAVGEKWVRVEFLCTSLPTGGDKGDQEYFLSYHFLVTIRGVGSNGAEYVVESEVSQKGPRPAGMEPDC